MWIRVALMPWWGRAGIYAGGGFICAAIFLAVAWLQGPVFFTTPMAMAIVAAAAALAGAGLGVLDGWSSRANSYRAALNALPLPAERLWAITAVWRGPIAQDPWIRATTAELARLYVRPYESRRKATVTLGVISALLLCLWVVSFLADHDRPDLWPVLIWLYFLGTSVWNWFAPRRVQRRLAELGAYPGSQPPSRNQTAR